MEYEFYKKESYNASSANTLTIKAEKRIRDFRNRQLGRLALGNIK